ncbi:MAG: efflux RND transporter permease subunit, partial [Oscillospiraceae bacterium]|nr:efflux RND transporter permease subunit [Oscillospiraceae bacterium]
NTVNKAHPWFDAMLRAYDRSVRVCLKHKVLPILLAVGLLAASAFGATRMVMVLLPEIGGNQLSVTVVLPEETERDDGYAAADAVMDAILTVPGVETVGAMSSGSMGGMLGGLGVGASEDYSNYMFYLMLDEDGSSRTDEVCAEIEAKTADIPNAEVLVSDGGAMDLSALSSTGLQVNLYGDDLDDLLAASEDVMALLDQVEGLTEISNGQEDGDPLIHLVIDRDAAMRQGLTVAQIYQELAAELTTETTSTTVTIDQEEMDVIVVVDEEDALVLDGLMDFDFKISKTDEEDGSTYTEHHKLSEFARREDGKGVAAVSRENQSRTMSVTAVTEAGYNTTLLSREVQDLLDDYQAPDGIEVAIGGESVSVNDMMFEMVKMIALAILFIYMIMVVQFQNLISPFIVMFTIPLAFTGGLLALMITGRPLSITGMMGFLMLAGVIVNNGIVFVDYANQLWSAGMPKTEALVATGRTRMRPILMTTLTTVLSMSVMLFKDDAGSAMGKDMSLVIIAGLMYATLMTLYIVPVLYDIICRKPPQNIDVGEDDVDELLDDAAEFMQQLEQEQAAQAAAGSGAGAEDDEGDDPVGTIYLQ